MPEESEQFMLDKQLNLYLSKDKDEKIDKLMASLFEVSKLYGNIGVVDAADRLYRLKFGYLWQGDKSDRR